MSLLDKRNQNTTNNPAFEAMDDAAAPAADTAASTATAATAAASTTATAATAAAPAVDLGATATVNLNDAVSSTTSEVAVVTNKAQIVASGGRVHRKIQSLFDPLKDVLAVDYNTLIQLFPNNGNIMDREKGTMLGDEIVFLLESWQDAFVVSPEDDNAPDEVVRYSDDGIICSDGTPVAEHLDWLQANGFPKARLKNRNVIVGLVQECAKQPQYVGELVQLDLPPSSKVMWDRYGIGALYAVNTNRFDKEQARKIRCTVSVTRKKDNLYTLASFEAAHLKNQRS